MSDPPLASFAARGMEKLETYGDGAVVLKVASALSDRHGHGRPPMANVRRGNKSEPLTKRDLHHRFWEARSRRDRVKKMLEERKAMLQGFFEKKADGHLNEDRL